MSLSSTSIFINIQLLCNWNRVKILAATWKKSSGVDETGDCGHSRHGPKTGLLCPVRGWAELGPRQTQCGLGQGLLPYQVASSSIQPFGHNRHAPKTGGCASFRGKMWPHLTQRRLDVAWTSVYLHTKWHLNPSSHLATTDMCRKLGGCAPLEEGELGSHLTQCGQGRGRPTCMPSRWCIGRSPPCHSVTFRNSGSIAPSRLTKQVLVRRHRMRKSSSSSSVSEFERSWNTLGRLCLNTTYTAAICRDVSIS